MRSVRVGHDQHMNASATLIAEVDAIGEASFTSPDYRPGAIVHVVLFRFSERINAAQKGEAMLGFQALATNATRDGRPYICSLETGARRDEAEFSHGFILTFASEGDRNYYVGKPIVKDSRHFDHAHDAFKEFVGPMLSDAVVFDFRAREDTGVVMGEFQPSTVPGDRNYEKKGYAVGNPSPKRVHMKHTPKNKRSRKSFIDTHLEVFFSLRDGKQISIPCTCALGATHVYTKEAGVSPDDVSTGDARVMSMQDARRFEEE